MKLQPTLSVSNYLIGKAHSEGERITPLKLLKLVYIAHGWCMGLTGKPLIGKEVLAWQYGPIITSVHQDFRAWGRNPIEQQKALWVGNEYVLPTVTDEQAQRLLDKVWQEYKVLDGLQLSTLARQEGTPWDRVRIQNGGRLRNSDGIVVPQPLLRDYYARLATKAPAPQGSTVSVPDKRPTY